MMPQERIEAITQLSRSPVTIEKARSMPVSIISTMGSFEHGSNPTQFHKSMQKEVLISPLNTTATVD